jgi:hypothetical protein
MISFTTLRKQHFFEKVKKKVLESKTDMKCWFYKQKKTGKSGIVELSIVRNQ